MFVPREVLEPCMRRIVIGKPPDQPDTRSDGVVMIGASEPREDALAAHVARYK